MENSDRELLGLAALAAGYDVIWNEHWQCFQHRNPKLDAHGIMRHPWTPDADDGEALRLAVKLDLLDEHADFTYKLAEEQNLTKDRDAATRRAILRAAAEIGKAMRAGGMPENPTV